jgi:hypothetical protein
MAERVASLDVYVRRLYGLVDDDAMRRIGKAAGFAGKDAGMDAARESLGQDRAMSNFKKGKVPLSVGFDQGSKASEVVLKHGPAGLWSLADKGRSGSGRIYPRTQRPVGGKPAGRKGSRTQPGRVVVTPQGPRAASSYSPSRGLGTLRKAAGKERTAVPKAAFKALQREIPNVLRKR